MWKVEEIKERKERCKEELTAQKAKDGLCSLMRLVTFAGAMILFGIAIFAKMALVLLPGALLLGAFFFFVLRSHRIEERTLRAASESKVLEGYLHRIEKDWTAPDFAMLPAPTGLLSADDLDLFGPNSLENMICVAHTRAGKQCLRNVLTEALSVSSEAGVTEKLRRRQEAVTELADATDFAILWESLGYQLAEKEEKQKKRATDADLPLDEKKAEALGAYPDWICSVLCILAYLGVGAAVCLGLTSPYLLLPVFFIALFAALTLGALRGDRVYRNLRDIKTMRDASEMIRTFDEAAFTSEELVELQGRLREGGALAGLRRLETLVAIYQLRTNPLVHWILNGLCMYDCMLYSATAKWVKTYGNTFAHAMEIIGEAEMLSSLAVIARTRPTCLPELVESETPVLTMKQGIHPLLRAKEVVANDADLVKGPYVITGSNMSGKTTYLRTIGINLVLAYAGAPVCAEGMRLSLMKLFTSMRVTDDLREGISTFYAEILRIQEMSKYLAEGKPMLCLIDEIFKGTNSADRILGATSAVKKLSSGNAILMVSTHDFELCNLGKNYHFEETYDEAGIRFDYRMKEGKCTTTNAMFLLRMAGLAE